MKYELRDEPGFAAIVDFPVDVQQLVADSEQWFMGIMDKNGAVVYVASEGGPTVEQWMEASSKGLAKLYGV